MIHLLSSFHIKRKTAFARILALKTEDGSPKSVFEYHFRKIFAEYPVNEGVLLARETIKKCVLRKVFSFESDKLGDDFSKDEF